MKNIKLTPSMQLEIERLLKRGSRVELAVEKGEIAVVEIKRKLTLHGDKIHIHDYDVSY